MSQIVVVGNFVVDIIGKPVDRLPQRGELELLETLETHVGGNGPNTAGALARLGASVAAIGRVGDDLYGRFLMEQMQQWGVETGGVVRDPESVTGVTFVAVDSTGERSFMHHLGANARLQASDVRWELLPAAKHLHLTAYFVLPALDGEPAAALLALAKARGVTTSLDVCWDRTGRWMETLRPCIPFTDVLMPSEEEGARLTGERDPARIAAALRSAGAKSVVLKLGERGCYYSGPEGEIAVPAFSVAVRETTGAGDCFIAGFLHARSRSWDIRRSLWFGNACGARSVQAVGGVTGMAPAAEIEAWANGLWR